ncbi:MAG: glycosyltransferase family 4 protein [Capsulimonadales bacterium]|nr:glycosyltransferase family 4 protein [Capsulimonadales bacterium]
MKIAIVHNTAPGGSKRALFEHVRGLATRGHRIDAYLPVEAEERYLPIREYCHSYREYGDAPASVGGSPLTNGESGLRRRLRRLLGPDVNDLLRDYFWVRRQRSRAQALAERYRQIADDIDRSDADLAYIHQCNLRLVPDVVRFLKRVPSVVYINDTLRRAHEWVAETATDYDALTETRFRRKRRGRIATPIFHAWPEEEDRAAADNLRRAGTVLVNSYYSREAFLRTTGVSARVLYLGTDTEFFRPIPDAPRAREVLSVGALRPEKRHEFVVDALATIPSESRPSFRILGYGLSDGKGGWTVNSQRLRQRADSAGVHLIIEEEVSDDRLRDAYRNASVFAFAPYLEPFGLVVLEAMASGLPVVALREAGPRETIRDGETGFLTDARPEVFGRALLHLLDDGERAAAMRQAARQDMIDRWTWNRSVGELEEVLTGALGSR